jgi:UDP-3-O-[3-hydroxymyristoyl] N-acetylglucosamine deacetylase
VILACDAFECPVERLVTTRTDYGVAVGSPDGGPSIDSVEHLFAALGGLGVRRGVFIEVRGGEVPLVDGAAAAFCEALVALDVPPSSPTLAVLRGGTITVGAATYAFSPAPAAGPSTTVDVAIDFVEPAIGRDQAAWDGTPRAFVRDIAWARTFGFGSEGAAMLAGGRARGADLGAVMVLDGEGRVMRPGLPARPGEFARHKLLDLVGDLYPFGGPPRGHLRASRPGHTATRAAVAAAIEQGLLGKMT